MLIACAAFILVVAGCGRRGGSTAQRGSGGGRSSHKTIKPSNYHAIKPSIPHEGPKLQMTQQGVTLSWIENGVVRMSAKAREGQINEVTKVGQLLDFSAKMFEDGKLTTTMSAPKVVADTEKRVVTATGGVTLKSLDRKTTVKAQWMKWYSRQHKVVGDGGVKITSEMGTMQGAAFVADTALKTLRVMNSAKGLEF